MHFKQFEPALTERGRAILGLEVARMTDGQIQRKIDRLYRQMEEANNAAKMALNLTWEILEYLEIEVSTRVLARRRGLADEQSR